jgi:hypothetical protein
MSTSAAASVEASLSSSPTSGVQGHPFLRAVRELLAAQVPPGPAIEHELNRVRALIAAGGWTAGPLVGPPHPAARHLAAALSSVTKPARALAEELARLAPSLPWKYGYAPRPDGPDLGDRIAFAELLGPEAPLRSDALCLGVTLIAPETLYPAHRHPAIELYLVLSGTAVWSAGGRSNLRQPGALVLHPSEVVHSMETGAEPLLALYSWTGADVRTTSRYT